MYARHPIARRRLYGILGFAMCSACFCHEYSGQGQSRDLDGQNFSEYEVARATSPQAWEACSRGTAETAIFLLGSD